MADAADALQNPTTRHAEREEVQQEWIVASAEYSQRAREALTKAADVLAAMPGRRPDAELAQAWAAVGQGWATLSQAESVRSTAVAAFAMDQTDATSTSST